jgi:hypothetical protein
MDFVTAIEIAYDNKQITTISSNIKFLEVYIDDRINLECHIACIH